MLSDWPDGLQYTYYGGQAEKRLGRELSGEWRVFPFAVLVCVEQGDSYLLWPDGRHTLALPGQALFVPPEVPHKYGVRGDSCISYLHVGMTAGDSLDVFQWFDLPDLLTAQQAARVHSLCLEVLHAREVRSDTTGQMRAKAAEHAAAFRLLECLLVCGRPSPDVELRMASYIKVKPVLQYIARHLDKPLTRTELAEVLFLSANRFHYVFKEAMGVSPMSYVKRERMKRAQLLLCDPQRTIGEVAVLLGFQEPSAFSHSFKAAVGMAPQAYRERVLYP